jgi:hypothetical protein
MMVRYVKRMDFLLLPLSVRRRTFSSKCAGSLTTVKLGPSDASVLHHLCVKYRGHRTPPDDPASFTDIGHILLQALIFRRRGLGFCRI